MKELIKGVGEAILNAGLYFVVPITMAIGTLLFAYPEFQQIYVSVLSWSMPSWKIVILYLVKLFGGGICLGLWGGLSFRRLVKN